MAAAGSFNKTDTFNKMVKDNCSCPVCFEEFKEPKSLPLCCHSFCEGCLQKLLKPPTAVSPQENIQCPLCQRISLIDGGVVNLPVNPILKDLLEHTPAAEARKELNRFLDQCFYELQRASTHIETIEKHTVEFNEYIKTQKELVNQTAERLKEGIDLKANSLLQDLDLHAARKVGSAREYQLEGVLCCSDTEDEFKRFRELIKNDFADDIVNKKDLYFKQLEDLKTNVQERTSNLLGEAIDHLGGNQKWPRFIPNANLNESVEGFQIGVLDTEGNQVCEGPDLVPDEERRPNRDDSNNITVKRITYTREDLLRLRYQPASLLKPEGLPDLVCKQTSKKQKFKKPFQSQVHFTGRQQQRPNYSFGLNGPDKMNNLNDHELEGVNDYEDAGANWGGAHGYQRAQNYGCDSDWDAYHDYW